jgi:cytochrome P450
MGIWLTIVSYSGSASSQRSASKSRIRAFEVLTLGAGVATTRRLLAIIVGCAGVQAVLGL